MSNSKLITDTVLSPYFSKRDSKIDTITIHHMQGVLSAKSCGHWFQHPLARGSSNYGIGPDGLIAMYVPEHFRSWCTSSSANDQRAITIEVSNSAAREPWPVSDEAYASLIKLCVDICERNDIKLLKWKDDPSLIGQPNKQNMTVHRWFAPKDCPGEYLYRRHGDIANKVNTQLRKNRFSKAMKKDGKATTSHKLKEFFKQEEEYEK